MYKPGPLALVLAAFVAIFLLLPLFAVVPVSFTPARFLTMPSGNWSLRHYQALVDKAITRKVTVFENPAKGAGENVAVKPVLTSTRRGVTVTVRF